MFLFHLKKTAAESHRISVDAYGKHALSKSTCHEWFQQFKNNDFEVNDKERPEQPKKFEDTELQALLDEDRCQTQKQLAEILGVTQAAVSKRLHAMGKILKCGKWVPHGLNDRQMENRKFTSKLSRKSKIGFKNGFHRNRRNFFGRCQKDGKMCEKQWKIL